jgi:bacillolysin
MRISGKSGWALGVLAVMSLSLSSASGTSVRPVLRDGESAVGQGKTVIATRGERANILSRRVDSAVASGGMKLAATQVEDLGGFVHERFDVYYKGLKVWGAQVLRHSRNGEVYLVNGEFHENIGIDVAPTVSPEQAVGMAATGLGDAAYAPAGTPELMIYPGTDAYHLAFQVIYAKPDSRIVTFVDAKTGQIVLRYEDVKTDAAIGVGTGTFGDTKKMSTEPSNGAYRAVDNMRPAQIITGTCANLTTGAAYYVLDDDNNWTSDPSVVDAHTYMGWIYDYYYLVHGRKSMNNNNGGLVIAVHFGTNYENAFYNSGNKYMYFGDADPSIHYPFAAALDIVAHEFTHGVTDATSNLIYSFESGALNEAFSDIMGVSCEFFHQAAGSGYLRAEWWEGEDVNKSFGPMRSLSNPSSLGVWGGHYPDHYSTRWVLPYASDNGGVHLNCTIASHWYYLLAQGGTNKTSGISVTGIGLSKAEQIAYKAWCYYFTPSTTFHNARAYTYQAAASLYGADSTEAQTVLAAWTAVGVN